MERFALVDILSEHGLDLSKVQARLDPHGVNSATVEPHSDIVPGFLMMRCLVAWHARKG